MPLLPNGSLLRVAAPSVMTLKFLAQRAVEQCSKPHKPVLGSFLGKTAIIMRQYSASHSSGHFSTRASARWPSVPILPAYREKMMEHPPTYRRKVIEQPLLDEQRKDMP